MQQAFDLALRERGSSEDNAWRSVGSVKCGVKVFATVCPRGNVETVGGQDNQIECEAESVGETEPGYEIDASEFDK